MHIFCILVGIQIWQRLQNEEITALQSKDYSFIRTGSSFSMARSKQLFLKHCNCQGMCVWLVGVFFQLRDKNFKPYVWWCRHAEQHTCPYESSFPYLIMHNWSLTLKNSTLATIPITESFRREDSRQRNTEAALTVAQHALGEGQRSYIILCF